MKNKKQKKINNIWFWLMLFFTFVILTIVILAVANPRFKQLWSFWGWYLILGILISLLITSIFLFVKKYRNINNHQKMNKLIDNKTKFK